MVALTSDPEQVLVALERDVVAVRDRKSVV